MANYPVPYQNNWGYSGIGQQVYPQYTPTVSTQPQQATQTPATGLIWVDGEVGAKAFQLPQGLPANQPVALWDTNDTVIYLKSVNQFGMPNPIQKARYKLEGVKSGEAAQAFSGELERKDPDLTQYVKKEDLERMKQDLMDTIGQMNVSGMRRNPKGE